MMDRRLFHGDSFHVHCMDPNSFRLLSFLVWLEGVPV